MSKDTNFRIECSTWRDQVDATYLAVHAARLYPSEPVPIPATRLNVRGYLGNWIALRFPWGEEKLLKPFEGFTVADPCQGSWKLLWWSSAPDPRSGFLDYLHIFTFEYIPAKPPEPGFFYSDSTIKAIEAGAVERGRENAHTAGVKERYEQGSIDCKGAILRQESYDEGFKHGVAHEKGYRKHLREVAYAQGYEKGVEHGKELAGKRLTATQVNEIQEKARADERSVFYAGIKEVLDELRYLQADADLDISNNSVCRRAGEFEIGHANGRGWAFSKARRILTKFFPNAS